MYTTYIPSRISIRRYVLDGETEYIMSQTRSWIFLNRDIQSSSTFEEETIRKSQRGFDASEYQMPPYFASIYSKYIYKCAVEEHLYIVIFRSYKPCLYLIIDLTRFRSSRKHFGRVKVLLHNPSPILPQLTACVSVPELYFDDK